MSIRWLAGRRLRRSFPFALVNRLHLVGVWTDEEGAAGLSAGIGASAW